MFFTLFGKSVFPQIAEIGNSGIMMNLNKVVYKILNRGKIVKNNSGKSVRLLGDFNDGTAALGRQLFAELFSKFIQKISSRNK